MSITGLTVGIRVNPVVQLMPTPPDGEFQGVLKGYHLFPGDMHDIANKIII